MNDSPTLEPTVILTRPGGPDPHRRIERATATPHPAAPVTPTEQPDIHEHIQLTADAAAAVEENLH